MNDRPTRWDYRTMLGAIDEYDGYSLTFNPGDGMDWLTLDDMGAQGWEMCGLVQPLGHAWVSAVFKRASSAE